MKPTVAILSIGVAPVEIFLPVLTDIISEDKINRINLLDNMSRVDIEQAYYPDSDEESFSILLHDMLPVMLGRHKLTRAIQHIVSHLDKQSYELILLLSPVPVQGLHVHNAMLLEPDRLVPQLVASVVDGHQVGIILPLSECIPFQDKKWQVLTSRPLYEIESHAFVSEQRLLDAGQKLLERGATVILLDCLEFFQKHRDFLQHKLNIPVLLSTIFAVKLAAELLD